MKAKFNWEDPFLLSQQLSDDERAIAEAARALRPDKLQPRVLMAARHEKLFDRDIMNEAGAMGFLGSTIEGYGCAGLGYVAYGLIAREVGAGGQRLPQRHQRAKLTGHAPHQRLRHRSAESRSTCPSSPPANGSAASV